MRKNKAHKQKESRFELRMDDRQRQILRQKAARAGLSQAEYLRELIEGHQIISKEQNEQTDKLLYELNRLGNNLNQIAHNFNSGFFSKEDMDGLRRLQIRLNAMAVKILDAWK